MTSRLSVVFVLVALTVLPGCRQSDGDLPPREGDVPQRLVDLGRDIEGVVAGDQQAVTDLTDDLLVFIEEPEGMEAARAMSKTICPMLVKRALNADAVNKLATLLWTTVAARDFSERQVDGLENDMRELLMSIGVSQQDANLAAGWVENVQEAVTERSRRWYERY